MSTAEQRRTFKRTSELQADDFIDELLAGLRAPRKHIPSRFFYDAKGSALFEEITQLPEYYPTRRETEILNRHGADIGAALADVDAIVEFGSGSSTKTEILLRHMANLSAYVAIDVSPTALFDAQSRLAENFPNLQLEIIVADFTDVLSLPDSIKGLKKSGYFPGSTIGNFQPQKAGQLLRTFSRTLGAPSRLVIGVDLKKDQSVLNRAYNDSAGITAEFNLNLLQRANAEANAEFNVDDFHHHAAYDPKTGGVDMYIISARAQTVAVNGHPVSFEEGEKIHTEHSHKYDLVEFQDVAQNSGWQVDRMWTDPNRMFAVFDLVSRSHTG